MTKQVIMSDRVPKSRVPLSHAVKTGNLVFVSGITPFDMENRVAKDDFPAQMRQVMENLKCVLEDAGSSLDKVVKTLVVLKRTSDFASMNEIYREYFTEGEYPARTTIGISLAGQDFLLEIECVAEA